MQIIQVKKMIPRASMAIEFDLINRSYKESSLHDLTTLSDEKIYWIHCDLTQKNDLAQLQKTLALPAELVALCASPDPIPKLIEEENGLILQIECCSKETSEEELIHFSDLIIYLTPRFCLTAAHHPIPALDEFIKHIPNAIRYAKTSCFILFLMIDNVINDYAQILFNFELMSEEMDDVVRHQQANIYQKVITAKQQLMKIKRYMIAIREVLIRISGRKLTLISASCQSSLSQLANHSHLIIYEIDSIRDILNSVLGQIDNNLMQDLNKSMRILTAFAAIFMPLTLITGIYGMNFHDIPELAWHYGYFYALGLLLFCALLILLIFKKLKMF